MPPYVGFDVPSFITLIMDCGDCGKNSTLTLVTHWHIPRDFLPEEGLNPSSIRPRSSITLSYPHPVFHAHRTLSSFPYRARAHFLLTFCHCFARIDEMIEREMRERGDWIGFPSHLTDLISLPACRVTSP